MIQKPQANQKLILFFCKLSRGEIRDNYIRAEGIVSQHSSEDPN